MAFSKRDKWDRLLRAIIVITATKAKYILKPIVNKVCKLQIREELKAKPMRKRNIETELYIEKIYIIIYYQFKNVHFDLIY